MKEQDITKEHLMRIGKRMRTIRKSKGLNLTDLTEMLSLKGGALQRFENGYGIHIINLLNILTWLDEEGYNIKWFLLFNNESEFQLKSDAISTLSGFGSVGEVLRKKEILEGLDELINKSEDIKQRVKKL